MVASSLRKYSWPHAVIASCLKQGFPRSILAGVWLSEYLEDLPFITCYPWAHVPMKRSKLGFAAFNLIFSCSCPSDLCVHEWIRSLCFSLKSATKYVSEMNVRRLPPCSGHLIGPVLCHSFCNYMGFPAISAALEHPHRTAVLTFYLLGVLLFLLFLFPFTDPFYYGLPTPVCTLVSSPSSLCVSWSLLSHSWAPSAKLEFRSGPVRFGPTPPPAMFAKLP